MQNVEKIGSCEEAADERLRAALTEWAVLYGDAWGDGGGASWETVRDWGVASIRGFLELKPSEGLYSTRLYYHLTPRGKEFVLNDIHKTSGAK